MNTETALEVVDSDRSLSRPLTIDEVHSNLEFVRNLMRREMQDGQDYGSIPGCGPRPTLLQPGAQKLLMTFNLTEEVKKEVLREFQGFHREYEFTITVRSANGKSWDGVGTCSTLESKYRYREAQRICPSCGKPAIIKGKAEYGGGWLCFAKKGGCGEKWAEGSVGAVKDIESQQVGKMENENPPDAWNTVRKMAFKRALVAAAINATNTSELWTQDMEDKGAPEPEKPKQDTPKEPEAGIDWKVKKPEPQPDTPKPEVTPKPTSATLDWALKHLVAQVGGANRDTVHNFLTACDILAPEKLLEQWPLEWVPKSHKELRELGAAIADFATGGQAHMPYSAWIEPVVVPAPAWQAYVITWGKLKDTALGQLPLDVLKDLWATFHPKDTYYNKKMGQEVKKWPEALKADKEMRDALDAAGKEKGFDQPAS